MASGWLERLVRCRCVTRVVYHKRPAGKQRATRRNTSIGVAMRGFSRHPGKKNDPGSISSRSPNAPIKRSWRRARKSAVPPIKSKMVGEDRPRRNTTIEATSRATDTTKGGASYLREIGTSGMPRSGLMTDRIPHADIAVAVISRATVNDKRRFSI